MTIKFSYGAAVLLSVLSSLVQAQEVTENDGTVTYSAAYFAEYGAVSVSDMLNRIPGIGLALEGNQVPSFGPGAGGDRGLGGEGQILINGKRLAGKANEASSQLDRISADQVNYIEIIRGTSGDLDVRNTGQLVNIVLNEELSTSNLSTELGFTRFDDGEVKPLGTVSYSGQTGQFNYLLSADVRSGYRLQESFETSLLADHSLNETRAYDRLTDQTNYRLNSNLVYQATPSDRIAFNALFSENDPSSELIRTITDYQSSPISSSIEREDMPATSDNWEFGGDYEHNFDDGGKFKLLFIVNERNNSNNRERFASSALGQEETKNLFLDTSSRYRERIVRTSYAWGVVEGQTLELGVEGAQTIQDSSLRLGLNVPGTSSPLHGGLTAIPVPNAFSEVEEMRMEGFAIHNWQINSRMSLESSLLYEVSEIEQAGDINKKRDFDFIKPKLDFRFDISRSFQLRMSAEKDVSQLSFRDFSAGVNQQDDDQDTVAGNPELEQEETWRYNINLDYRLPNDGGVLNSRFFYYDVGNSIGKIDVSPDPQNLVSTNGNVGDGKVFALYLNASIRLGFLNLPQAVVTASLNLEDAYLYDPLIGKTRTIVPFDRGGIRLGYRQDMPERNLSFGINYQEPIGGMGGTGGNRVQYDIDNVTFYNGGKLSSNLTLFAEKTGFANLTYRMEINNGLDHEFCTQRKRFNGYLRDRDLIEIENTCSANGPEFVFKVRSTF
ncbi:MAG: TonB-dependent receptor plug domain-containing protein [Gammaproteobacteria bacterium]|nr:TonB-dependent receptor plug domain-containing protein [Gammaproteobacteria bacterium]MBT3859007.1 TonB-dependent receptor plug domain-containing protein [Gammaproteobacteria bacterium]MBT3987882.1 TonB-dependent receptor plug domain-containing protein [Gammaproteobacteria bacterium]MBT4583320.1 TonB-dependent receptor plug domain-containing protein [Gammaproteobacteria bacterium]MBT4659898.1 TonB-dependent receptor plug domain-containing protein [Gammaproteobacteria bacterium]